MKCKFDITYLQLTPPVEPAEGDTSGALHKTVTAEFPDGTTLDEARQAIAFEMEEQHCRLIIMEGWIIE
jgi:hypothetical protein